MATKSAFGFALSMFWHTQSLFAILTFLNVLYIHEPVALLTSCSFGGMCYSSMYMHRYGLYLGGQTLYQVFGIEGGLQVGEGSMMPLWVCFHMFEFYCAFRRFVFIRYVGKLT